MAEVATEPAWLAERRQRGASLAREPPPPRPEVEGLGIHRPLASSTSTPTSAADAEAAIEGAEGATVVSARRGARVPRRAARTSGSARWSRSRTPSSPATRPSWRDGVLVHVPRGVKLDRADPDRGPGRRGRRRGQLAHPDRARGGRRGGGLGALVLARRRDRRAAQLGGRAAASARRRRCATSTPRTSPRRPGSSPPSAPRSSATAASTGRRSASARPAARCGWRPSSPARAPRRG